MSTRRKRLVVIVGMGAAFFVGVVFYKQYFLSRPIGHGPAGPQVSHHDFVNPWTNRVVQFVGIGDSITAGLGARKQDHTSFNRLLKNPEDEYADMKGICLFTVLPNLESENLAVSGSTSREHLAVIEERLTKRDPSVFGIVVITTGGNDLIHSYGRSPPKECAMYGATSPQAEPWITAFRLRIDEMLQRIKACFPGGCEIYIGDIYDPTDGIGDAPSVYLPHWPDGLAIHAKYNAVITECANSQSNVHVVPLYQTFMGHGAHCRQFWRSTYVREDPNYWFYDNIEDPNDRGYDAIRRVFLNTIVKHSSLVPVPQSSEGNGAEH